MTEGLERTSVEEVILQHDLEQFFYEEAALLDARRFEEWYALLDDELEYFMPVRTVRQSEQEALEFARPGEGAFFDDDKDSMGQRVRKLRFPFSWSEDPPSRTRHHVTNLRILDRSGDRITTSANFLVYRSRLANEVDVWSGRREDTLRVKGGSFTIVKRVLYLDDARLGSKNLSIFF